MSSVTCVRRHYADDQSIGIGTGYIRNAGQRGGGMIFKLAQEKLSAGEFARINEKVSGIDDMLSAAPATESGGLMGGVGRLMSAVGGGAGNLGALAGLADGFEKLGMDGGMIGRFVPIVLDAVRNQGGDAVGSLLQGVPSHD